MGLNIYGVPDIVCQLYNVGATTVGNNVDVTWTFNTEITDPANVFDASVSPTDITIPVTGLYYINAHVGWVGNVTGYRKIVVQVNAVESGIFDARTGATATTVTEQHADGLLYLNADDILQVHIRQTSGGNLNTQAGSAIYPNFTLMLIALTEP